MSIIVSSSTLEVPKSIVLYSIFSGRKLDFPSMNAETLSRAICSSVFFILSLGCINLFVYFFSLSLGCKGTCLTNMTSSSFCFLVSLAKLSLGSRGTCLTNMTSSSFCFLFSLANLSLRWRGTCLANMGCHLFFFLFFL